MALKEKVIKGLAWTSLQGAGSQAISFLVFLVLARLLDPESFGLVAMAMVAVAFFKLFGNFGFGAAIIQRKQLEPDHLDTAFWVDIFVGIFMMSITFLTAPWVAELYSEPRLQEIIQWLSLLFLPTALSQVQTSILRRELALRPLAIRTLISEVIGGVTGVGCAIAGFGVWSLVARQLVTTFIGLFLLWYLSEWRPRLVFSRQRFRELFGFSSKILSANIIDFMSKKSDSFLIGYFLGPVALGYYTIAYRLVYLLTDFLGGTINRVAWPAFSRLQDQPEKIRSGFLSASQILGLVVLPIFLGIFATAPDLVPVVFGPQWGQSIAILEILVFVGIILSLNSMYNTIIVSMGRPGLWLALHTAIGVSNVAGFFIGLRWGITGVAFAYLSVCCFYLPIYLYILNRLAGISTYKYVKALLAPAFASLIMIAIVVGFRSLLAEQMSPLPLLVTQVSIGVLSYILLIRLISPAVFQQLIDTAKTLRPAK